MVSQGDEDRELLGSVNKLFSVEAVEEVAQGRAKDDVKGGPPNEPFGNPGIFGASRKYQGPIFILRRVGNWGEGRLNHRSVNEGGGSGNLSGVGRGPEDPTKQLWHE